MFWQTVKLEDARDPKIVLSFKLFSAVQLNLLSRVCTPRLVLYSIRYGRYQISIFIYTFIGNGIQLKLMKLTSAFKS